MPTVCVRVGIQERVENDDAQEAFRSKRIYVKNRLLPRNEPDLLRIAVAVLKEYEAPTLADTVTEMTTHADHRISEITRRDLLKALNPLDTLR